MAQHGFVSWWIKTWGDFTTIKPDPRTQSWPFMTSPMPVLSCIVTYLVLVQAAQTWMRDKKPYDVRRFMVVHNFILVALSAHTFWEIFRTTILNPSFRNICHPISNSSTELAAALWWFHVSKMFDLFDTLYLILRKRNVSILHSYHHSSVMYLSWVIARYFPGGSAYFGPMLNSFVHMIMYTYYGLAAMGPHMQKYLWWKRYLTRLQLAQFVVLFTYTSVILIFMDCGFPSLWKLMQMFYALSLGVLFCNFYYQTYLKGGPRKQLLKCVPQTLVEDTTENASEHAKDK